MRLLRTFVSVLGLSLFALSAQAAGWTLDGENSSLHFVSVKKSAIGEIHHFSDVQGSLSADGKASITIDLASVDTGIQIRDERMQSMLFEVGSFATARISADFDSGSLDNLKTGESMLVDQSLTLDLHGVSKSLTAALRVTRLADGGVLITSLAPLVISAADYGLDSGVEKLREVAGLPSISLAVPVTVNLVFTPD